jgi:predicted amidohydrolase YtcJ
LPQTAGQELDDLRRWTTNIVPGQGDGWLRANGAGEALVLAALDFENFAEPRPEICERALVDFESAVRLLVENGWGFRVHATYDQTLGQFLDIFDRIGTDCLFPGEGRWFFDHAETATPATLERIKALGGAVSVQNRLMFQGRSFAERYGAGQAETAPPIRQMLDSDPTVGAGTDATRASSYNPWYSLAWLVTGRTIGGLRLFRPDNRVDRQTALEMYTKAGAALSGESDVKGTITVGRYGDLAILSADYFTVADQDTSRIESVLTVTGGNIVYATADYQGMAPDLPAVNPAWSPIARLGELTREPSGVAQAKTIVDAAHDADEQRTWQASREGRLPASEVPNLAAIRLQNGCS